MIPVWRRVDAALRKPHPRERRDRVDIAARIIAWPVIAVSLVMMAIGWTRPEILDDGERPVQTWRMETHARALIDHRGV